MSRRRLSHDEVELWRIVTETVRPLVPRKNEMFQATPDVPKAETRIASGTSMALAAARPDRKHLGDIERRARRDLVKGRVQFDARLDLHGHTLAEAHRRVTGFLHRVHDENARYVLIVTGKGKTAGGEFGPLRRQTPMWLADPKLRHIVAAYGEASAAHGGAGALYVRLRKR